MFVVRNSTIAVTITTLLIAVTLACETALEAPPTSTAAVYAPTSISRPTATIVAAPTVATKPSPHAISGTAGLIVPTGLVEARVVNVVDGDTIDVLISGRQYRIRYIGIDTPETVDPRQAVQPFGKEASDRNRVLVHGKTVYLEKDVSETDRYDRLLRYVWLDDTSMVNAVLVSEGLAQVSTYPPDVKHTDTFIELQRQAREQGRGMWAGLGGGAIQATPTAPTAATAPTAQSGDCDQSYPGLCIPPYPPDLDCGDITFRRFQVVPPDPHRFDGEGNGIGCES